MTEQHGAHPDLALVRDVLADDPRALREFVARMRCVPRILAALNARRGRPLDRHDLADTAQDVLVVIWRKLDRYEARASLEGWAYGLCHLELMNAIRRRSRAPGELEDVAGERLATQAPSAGGWDAEQIHKGIDWLGEPGASVVRLKHFEGLTFDEIGRRLDLPTNTAKTRYYRSLEALQEHLRARLGDRTSERTRS